MDPTLRRKLGIALAACLIVAGVAVGVVSAAFAARIARGSGNGITTFSSSSLQTNPEIASSSTSSSSSSSVSGSGSGSCGALAWSSAFVGDVGAADLVAVIEPSSGSPLFAYGAADGSVRARLLAGGLWNETVVDPRGAFVPNRASLSAAEVDGAVALAYCEGLGLAFAVYDAALASWSVADLGEGGLYASMAAAPDGQPSVAHVISGVANSTLRITTRDSGGSWYGRDVASSAGGWNALSLAFSGALPAIAFSAGPENLYGAFVSDGASWVREDFDFARGSQLYAPMSLALADGDLALAYEAPSASDSRHSVLKYARRALNWAAEVVATPDAHFLFPALAEVCGEPWLAYAMPRLAGLELVLARRASSSGSWETASSRLVSGWAFGRGSAILETNRTPAAYWSVGPDAFRSVWNASASPA
jgi:hypothetical protein